MREIRFRAWIEGGAVDSGMYYQEVNAHMSPVFSKAQYGLMNPFIKIMQYTGLKDKNGKEIYEGDILRYYKAYEYEELDSPDDNNKPLIYESEEETKISEVKWQNISFTFFGCYGKYQTSLHEVIGNIHQNPELLTQKQ